MLLGTSIITYRVKEENNNTICNQRCVNLEFVLRIALELQAHVKDFSKMESIVPSFCM